MFFINLFRVDYNIKQQKRKYNLRSIFKISSYEKRRNFVLKNYNNYDIIHV